MILDHFSRNYAEKKCYLCIMESTVQTCATFWKEHCANIMQKYAVYCRTLSKIIQSMQSHETYANSALCTPYFADGGSTAAGVNCPGGQMP